MTSALAGTVFTPTGADPAEVRFAAGLILGIEAPANRVAVDDSAVVPGFIDTHIHGAIGMDFTADPETIWDVGAWLPSTGVTSFVPSIVTAPYETYDRAIAIMQAGPPQGYAGADAIGLHFEGPWISPKWKGAHRTSLLAEPDLAVAAAWAASGVVSIVTMAAELPGAHDAARVLAEGRVVVSLGHTGATYDEGLAALRGPWSSVTHLFNQMSGFEHRSPGVVAAALNSDSTCELIADGFHSDPGALELAWQVLGPYRTVLMTDAMQATGLGKGTYRLGGLEVTVTETGPRLPDGRLASSTLTMDRAVSNLVGWTSASLAEAITAATATPARRLRLADRGSIRAGQRADLVVLARSGSVLSTYVGGKEAYASS